MAMLPEIQMSVHEISKNTIASMPLESDNQEPGGVDPVHDETKLEFVTSDEGNTILPEWKMELDAGEDEDKNAVMEASDSNHKPQVKTRSK